MKRVSRLLLIGLVLWTSNVFSKSAEKSYSFKKLIDNVYVMHGPIETPNVENKGFMNNPGLIVAKGGLIIVDPGGTYDTGKMVLREAKKISNKKVVAVFNTHVHGDHWLGNQAIKEAFPKAKLYGHKNMIQRAKDGDAKVWLKLMSDYTKGLSDNTKAVIPKNAVKHLDVIVAGGDKFIIHSPFDKSHTNSDIMVEHVKSKTIFMGDNSLIGRLGNFDASSSMIGNLKIFDYVGKMKYFVPGHGKSGDFKLSAKPFRDYLKITHQEAQKAYDDDLEIFEIKKKAKKKLHRYRTWKNFEAKIGQHLAKMKTEIEALEF